MIPAARAGHRRVHDHRAGRRAQALLHNLLHNKVLHARVVLVVNVVTEDIPCVPDAERVRVEGLDFRLLSGVRALRLQDDLHSGGAGDVRRSGLCPSS